MTTRADHSKFNNAVKNLREAWSDLNLDTYDLYYETYGNRIRLICPDEFATQYDVEGHRHNNGVYKILWNYWTRMNNYLRECTAAQQRYLARKHRMIKAR